MQLLAKNDRYLIHHRGWHFEALRQAMIWRRTLFTEIRLRDFKRVTYKKESSYVLDSFRRWFKENFFKTSLAALNHFSNEYGLGYVQMGDGNPTVYRIITPTGMTIGYLTLLKNNLGFSVHTIEFKKVGRTLDSEHDANGDR